MNAPPYIEICGITEVGQAEAIRSRVRHAYLEDASDRRLVFGVMASRRTVIESKPNEWPHRYPRSEQLPGLFEQRNPLDPVEMWLHYEDNGDKSDDSTLFDRVSFAVEACLGEEFGMRSDGVEGPWGIQIDCAWPDPIQMKKIASEFPFVEIALQIGPAAMAKIAPGTPLFYETIDAYAYKINHLLLDFSAGTGANIPMRQAEEVLCALRDEYPLLGLGVAGGLCQERVYEAANMLCNIPRLNTSMLSAVRIPTDGGGILDIDRAVAAVGAVLTLTTQN